MAFKVRQNSTFQFEVVVLQFLPRSAVRIKKLLKAERVLMLCKEILPSHDDKVPVLLLGHPAYPLLPYCMKEFPNPHNNEEVIFNNMLRGRRNRFKAKWQVLNKCLDMASKSVSNIVYACFFLHNICEMKGVPIYDDIVVWQIAVVTKRRNDLQPPKTI